MLYAILKYKINTCPHIHTYPQRRKKKEAKKKEETSYCYFFNSQRIKHTRLDCVRNAPQSEQIAFVGQARTIL
jgi:hypothetical protein